MTNDDIVTRLEQEHWCDADNCNLAQLAADEIERLRAALAIAAGMISTMPHYEHEHAESIMNMLLAEAGAKAVRGE